MTPASPHANGRHDTLSRMPGRGTTRRTIRMDSALWDALGEAAAAAGTDRAAILKELARWYVRAEGAALPERPAEPPQ